MVIKDCERSRDNNTIKFICWILIYKSYNVFFIELKKFNKIYIKLYKVYL